MTVTIDLAPEEEQNLRQQAEMAGQDVQDYLREIVRARTWVARPRLSPEEWEKLADEAASIVPDDVPPLSDYAVSRAAMYEGRY